MRPHPRIGSPQSHSFFYTHHEVVTKTNISSAHDRPLPSTFPVRHVDAFFETRAHAFVVPGASRIFGPPSIRAALCTRPRLVWVGFRV